MNNLLREVNILKNDFIRKNQEMKKELRAINDDVLEFKREQEKTLQKMDLIIAELKKTAGIEEVMTLKKYIEYWNPINFVTQRDLDRAIRSRMEVKPTEKSDEESKKSKKKKVASHIG